MYSSRVLFPAVQALHCQVLDPDLVPGAASHLCWAAINFMEMTGAVAAHPARPSPL